MNTVTVTSQGQITLPANVRKLLNIKSADKLRVDIDPETRTISLQKPMTVDEATTFFDGIPRADVPPLRDVHEYYATERTKEIVARMRDNS